MPVCYITVSENIGDLSSEILDSIRTIVAEGLNSKARILDKNHIAIRINKSYRAHMLGEIELDILAQFYLRRFFDRDRRANYIASEVTKLLNFDCATWINLNIVGYSRVTKMGEIHYSD